ncbi:hypothetical protein AAIR98_001979 [Elusimicrobium simillimum]
MAQKVQYYNATTILMPSSYTMFTPETPPETAKRLITIADRTVCRLALDIINGKSNMRSFKTPFYLKLHYRIMYKFFRKYWCLSFGSILRCRTSAYLAAFAPKSALWAPLLWKTAARLARWLPAMRALF